MPPPDDSVLLRQYAEDHSDEAFAALVTRHINLVYSVAVRCVGDPHQAEEVAQAVFILLAKKAGHLRHDKALSSWLFQATRLTASNFVRSETRRQRREQEAHMQSVSNDSGGDVWPRIAPLLDDAVAGLNEKERHAIVLRFYEGRNLREVGAALGASEDAAEKRVNRAVEKLRTFLAKHGVNVGASGLVVVISANAVQAAPVALDAAITTTALSSVSGLSISTLGIVQWLITTRMKTALLIAVLALGIAVLLLIPKASLPSSANAPATASQPANVDAENAENLKDQGDAAVASRSVTTDAQQAERIGARYSIQGSFTYQVYALQNDGEPLKQEPLARQFEVQVDGCKWRVRVVLVSNPNFDSFVYSYDGTNLAHFSSLPNGGIAGGSIDASPVPGTITSAAGEYAWLAFASGCYLKRCTNNSITSFRRLNSMNGTGFIRRYEVPCRITLSSSPPHLPIRLQYIDTNRVTYLSSEGALMSTPLPASFGTNGFVSAEFRSEAFTNFNSYSFPTRFEYRAFKPAPKAETANDLRCVVEVVGVVTNIVGDSILLDTSLPGRRFVAQDVRVPEPGVQYAITNGVVPAEGSPFLEKQRIQAIKRLDQQRQNQDRSANP